MMIREASKQTKIVSETIWKQMAKKQWIVIIHFMAIKYTWIKYAKSVV